MVLAQRLAFTLIVLAATASTAFALPVTVQASTYNGRYYIDGAGPYFGNGTFDLATGTTHYLDTGAGIGRSAFTFSVDTSGDVVNIAPSGPASASGSTITFTPVTIGIVASTYTGRYFISTFGTATELRGDQPAVAVLPGLSYTIDDGAEAATQSEQSDFVFSVDAAGFVRTSSPAARADGTTTTLALTTVPVQINPQAYPAAYFLSSFFPTPFTGTQTLGLMPGLLYTLDDGAEIGGSAFAFFVDGAGQVSTTSIAASGTGNVLTLSNTLLRLTSTCSGSYSITGYPNLSGSADVTLIPGLKVVVTTPEGSTTITPTGGAFAITADCVSVSNETAAVQPPIAADGSSVFNANRGVVPVKFTLLINGASTCQLPPATISLLRTGGSAEGVVNQSDYTQPSDSGSNFRIDISACQYVYNLGTSTLGAGQYVAQISINNVVVGNGAFGLK